jgi:hypothetical protein
MSTRRRETGHAPREKSGSEQRTSAESIGGSWTGKVHGMSECKPEKQASIEAAGAADQTPT